MKFEYEEIVDNDSVHFKVIPKGSDDQRNQIQVTTNGIEIQNNTLAASGGEQIYEYEVHIHYIKRSNSYNRKHRKI